MKTFTIAALAGTTLAVGGNWLPSCSWNDCLGSWNGASCTQQSGWDCICSNSTAIAQINTCVATSCTNATDQEQIYGAIAQLCANAGKTVTNSQQATFSATSGGSLGLASATHGWGPGGNWNSGDWASWASAVSTAVGSAPSGWGPGGSWGNGWGRPGNGNGGPGGPGGFGGFGGPWGTKASGIACSGTAAWTTWTAGWGPYSSWTGLWSGCSTRTATPAPATVTTTVTRSGSVAVLTGTTFGIQALSQSVSSGTASGTSAAGSAATTLDTTKVLTFSGAAAAAVFALMVAL